MLHVPQIARNLLSIAQITDDNNVEFNSHSIFVKDRDLRKALAPFIMDKDAN